MTAGSNKHEPRTVGQEKTTPAPAGTLSRLEQAGLLTRRDPSLHDDLDQSDWRLTEAGLDAAVGFLSRMSSGPAVPTSREEAQSAEFAGRLSDQDAAPDKSSSS
jgi:hypothetical protein